jgi:3',5'-cyclic-AMP phosphodiesterase
MVTMHRREFIRQIGIGLGAGLVAGRLCWPSQAWAAPPGLRLALLADAHLSGDERAPEARALARAVAEVNALSPPPDLVVFAGDLAHRGQPGALDLGRDILADLSSPLKALRGEADCGGGGDAPWIQRFGEPRFSCTYRGVHIFGLDTSLRPTAHGSAFEIGAVQRRWLAAELAVLSQATPLVVVSHAPLARVFYPWQQWTADAAEIVPQLARFEQVLCLHGHGHGIGLNSQFPGACKGNDPGNLRLAEGRKTHNGNHLSLPATSWPRPQALQGTPAVTRPGLGPCGCGWVLITLSPGATGFHPYLWTA